MFTLIKYSIKFDQRRPKPKPRKKVNEFGENNRMRRAQRLKKLMKITGLAKMTVYNRMLKGMTDKQIINTPCRKPILITYVGLTKSPKQWANTNLCKGLNLDDNLIRLRYKNGWDVTRIFTEPNNNNQCTIM